MAELCPIWGTPARVQDSGTSGDYIVVDSPRAGGEYRIARSVRRNLSPAEKAKLTSWLREQRGLGEPSPLITSHSLAVAVSRPELGVLERRDRALEFLACSSPTLSATVRVRGKVDEERNANLNGLRLVTDSRDDGEANALLTFLERSGLIEWKDDSVRLTFDGWSYLEKQRATQVASVQAFVAMWFNPSMEAPYDEGIRPAIQDCGYSVMRIDKKEHINKIDDEIIAEIRRSRFLVADFTSEPDKPRGGVYFEAGFALGLNKPVIWTCRADVIGSVHFDTRQFNHITWEDPQDLYTRLKNRIGAVLGQGPVIQGP